MAQNRTERKVVDDYLKAQILLMVAKSRQGAETNHSANALRFAQAANELAETAERLRLLTKG